VTAAEIILGLQSRLAKAEEDKRRMAELLGRAEG
jgi:hypothetical protein